MFRRKKTYNIDVNTAGKMLENVFAACDTEPNTIDFETIYNRGKISFVRDNICIIAACVLFLVTFFLPLFFPPSNIFMSADAKYGHPLSVNAHSMTEDSFSISFEGEALDITKCVMVGDDGTSFSPKEYYREDNRVVFPYVPQQYNIYVYDINGRCIHLLLSPKNRS